MLHAVVYRPSMHWAPKVLGQDRVVDSRGVAINHFRCTTWFPQQPSSSADSTMRQNLPQPVLVPEGHFTNKALDQDKASEKLPCSVPRVQDVLQDTNRH